MDIYWAFNIDHSLVGPGEKSLVKQNKYVKVFMIYLSQSPLLRKALENGACSNPS